ncbi:hypothetical protein [Pseudomonas amygdali]|uniref:Uncharacterized protein n=2 Tax=Pseudomonas amygdali pv. lachrymans TaxID=53707 RepID=A0AAD0PWC9_PSEAV|nr:hypothetical protein [Pseudomonas amygdali]AXH59981.1 hypothetical protein PLA107_032665 [Pseudomonas amygdali pv. lachrymans str. M301315]
MLKKPTEIVCDILAALKANDAQAVHQHVDDLQESLVSRLMGGDFVSQHDAYQQLLGSVRESKDLGDDAVQAMLAKIGIDNRTAMKIIERHESPLVNQAVAANLMHHKPVVTEDQISDFYLATYWLCSGDYEIFDAFAASLFDKPCDKMKLQADILRDLFGRLGEHEDIYFNWVARHQDKIIGLSDGDATNFEHLGLHRGVKLHDLHITKLAELIASNSRQSPNRSDLYEMRTKQGVILPPERLQSEWSGRGSSMGWSEQTLQALMIYHLAFEDSPAPSYVGGQQTEAAEALVQAMYYLRENAIEAIPTHLDQILTGILKNLEEDDLKEEGLEILGRTEFKREFQVNSAFRDGHFGVDLGL